MFRYWIVFVVIFCSLPSFATEVNDLYRAKADLLSQSKTDKDNAISAAMEKVLIKIAGNKEFLSDPVIQKELQHHSRYMTRFNFSREDGVNKLVATFDENKIKKIFMDNNIPLWGSLRPLVLVWIVNNDGSFKTIVAENENSALHDVVFAAAEEKGLPIVLPLMDLTDAQNIQASDLWGRFMSPIKNASERYAPEKIAIIRMTQQTNVLQSKQVDWYMFDTNNNNIETGSNIQGENETELLQQAITDITENIASTYALSTDINHEMLIEVDGINSLTTFVDVTRFLDKLSAVTDVQLVKAKGSVRTFKLAFMGTQESLFNTLSLNDNLKIQEQLTLDLEPVDTESVNTQNLYSQREYIQNVDTDADTNTDNVITEKVSVEHPAQEYIPLFYWRKE